MTEEQKRELDRLTEHRDKLAQEYSKARMDYYNYIKDITKVNADSYQKYRYKYICITVDSLDTFDIRIFVTKIESDGDHINLNGLVIRPDAFDYTFFNYDTVKVDDSYKIEILDDSEIETDIDFIMKKVKNRIASLRR